MTNVLDVVSRDKLNSDVKAQGDGKEVFTNVTKPEGGNASGFFSVKASAQENYTKTD